MKYKVYHSPHITLSLTVNEFKQIYNRIVKADTIIDNDLFITLKDINGYVDSEPRLLFSNFKDEEER